jgi:dTDP-4-dehydrorhamnose reductase
MRRILFTGGSGFLGTVLSQRPIAAQLHFTYFSHSLANPNAHYLDARDEAQVDALVQAVQPQAIIHAACSNSTPAQIESIVPAARAIATIARRYNLRLVHLSSDVVFDGEHAPYADDAPLSPVHAYGQAKAETEHVVSALCPTAVIVRPSLIWCLNPFDHQTRWLVEAVQQQKSLTLFTDELRCPVHVHDVCAALLELSKRDDIHGPLNLGGPQAFTRWAWGQRLLAALSLTTSDALKPGTVGASSITRPRNLTLISQRATTLLHTRLRSIDDF